MFDRGGVTPDDCVGEGMYPDAVTSEVAGGSQAVILRGPRPQKLFSNRPAGSWARGLLSSESRTGADRAARLATVADGALPISWSVNLHDLV